MARRRARACAPVPGAARRGLVSPNPNPNARCSTRRRDPTLLSAEYPPACARCSISSAIVCADARSIRNHAASLATQLSYGMI